MVHKHITTGMKVKDLRSRAGMTQEQFAQHFHINISTLRMWEQGVNKCPSYVLWCIDRILELEGK